MNATKSLRAANIIVDGIDLFCVDANKDYSSRQAIWRSIRPKRSWDFSTAWKAWRKRDIERTNEARSVARRERSFDGISLEDDALGVAVAERKTAEFYQQQIVEHSVQQ